MRTIVSACVLLLLSSTPALAQPAVGPPRLSPAVGLAIGASGRLDSSLPAPGNHHQPMISGTFDIPLTSNGSIRVEGCRLPLGPDGMHLSCINVGAVGLTAPAAHVSPYFGVSYGIYRASLDRTGSLSWKGGVHFYGGVQLRVADHLTLDAGFGIHLLREELIDPGVLAPAEAIVGVKFAI